MRWERKDRPGQATRRSWYITMTMLRVTRQQRQNLNWIFLDWISETPTSARSCSTRLCILSCIKREILQRDWNSPRSIVIFHISWPTLVQKCFQCIGETIWEMFVIQRPVFWEGMKTSRNKFWRRRRCAESYYVRLVKVW